MQAMITLKDNIYVIELIDGDLKGSQAIIEPNSVDPRKALGFLGLTEEECETVELIGKPHVSWEYQIVYKNIDSGKIFKIENLTINIDGVAVKAKEFIGSLYIPIHSYGLLRHEYLKYNVTPLKWEDGAFLRESKCLDYSRIQLEYRTDVFSKDNLDEMLEIASEEIDRLLCGAFDVLEKERVNLFERGFGAKKEIKVHRSMHTYTKLN